MRLALTIALLTLAGCTTSFDPQNRASIAELLRWDAYGCTTDTDCERMQSWILTRYHFEKE